MCAGSYVRTGTTRWRCKSISCSLRSKWVGSSLALESRMQHKRWAHHQEGKNRGSWASFNADRNSTWGCQASFHIDPSASPAVLAACQVTRTRRRRLLQADARRGELKVEAAVWCAASPRISRADQKLAWPLSRALAIQAVSCPVPAKKYCGEKFQGDIPCYGKKNAIYSGKLYQRMQVTQNIQKQKIIPFDKGIGGNGQLELPPWRHIRSKKITFKR